MKFRPQILTAILSLFVLGALGIFFAPDYTDVITVACITGIIALGKDLLSSGTN